MEELKPCPFCGADVVEPYKLNQKGRPIWEIHCSLFCVRMKWNTKKGLIERWNTRKGE